VTLHIAFDKMSTTDLMRKKQYCIWGQFQLFLNKKIAYDLKSTGHIVMKFYIVMYHSWYSKSNKNDDDDDDVQWFNVHLRAD